MVTEHYFKISPITLYPKKNEIAENPLFSILIVSWNNLEYLKICVESIRKNSSFNHQILIHVNDGSDGTLEWVTENGFAHSHSSENVGICFGMNALTPMIESEYVVLIDDDNYVAPRWDFFLYEEIHKIGHPYFALSSTRMEPYVNRDSTAITPASFGFTPKTFKEKDFLLDYMDFACDDWSGSSWYPMVIHRDVWCLVGGLSTEFSPGIGSDPDFMMKLWQAGVRYYKGLSNSRAYHFVSATTARVKRNNGRKQFAQKWGMNISTFFKYYIRMGQSFDGVFDEKASLCQAQNKIIFDRMRMKLNR